MMYWLVLNEVNTPTHINWAWDIDQTRQKTVYGNKISLQLLATIYLEIILSYDGGTLRGGLTISHNPGLINIGVFNLRTMDYRCVC